MKLKLIILLTIASTTVFSQKNTLTLTASGGLHLTKTRITGSNPLLYEHNLITISPQFKTTIFRYGKKKSAGLFLGLGTTSTTLAVKLASNPTPTLFSRKMTSSRNLVRIDAGYHLSLKKVFMNNVLNESGKKNEGFFLQAQPIFGLTFTIDNTSGIGLIGNGDIRLSVNDYPQRVLGFIYGANFYFGKNDKTWGFLTLNHNLNLAYYIKKGTLSTNLNGNIIYNAVQTNGNGFSATLGVILLKIKYGK